MDRTFEIRTFMSGFQKPDMFGNQTEVKIAENRMFGFRTSTVYGNMCLDPNKLKIHPIEMATFKKKFLSKLCNFLTTTL